MGKDLWRGIAMQLRGEEIAWLLPNVGKDLQGRIAMHLKGRNLNSFPLWEE